MVMTIVNRQPLWHPDICLSLEKSTALFHKSMCSSLSSRELNFPCWASLTACCIRSSMFLKRCSSLVVTLNKRWPDESLYVGHWYLLCPCDNHFHKLTHALYAWLGMDRTDKEAVKLIWCITTRKNPRFWHRLVLPHFPVGARHRRTFCWSEKRSEVHYNRNQWREFCVITLRSSCHPQNNTLESSFLGGRVV